MDALDPKRLRITRVIAAGPCSARPPRHRPGEKFLKGPVPWDWLGRAASQPGRALRGAIAVWGAAGITRARTVSRQPSVLRSLGVSRYAGYRALAALEGAGLLEVQRHPGRSPVVTILDPGDWRENP